MKLKNLIKCYIYEQEVTKIDGENSKKWKFKFEKNLNVQQDINELDRNSAGLIDFDKLKIRTDYSININKNDGLSLFKLEIGEGNYALTSPDYKVISNPKIGNTTIYTCERYHGD